MPLWEGSNLSLFQHIIRFMDVFRMKIMSNPMGKAYLLVEPLTKTESKKCMKIVCKLSKFGLLIEMILNIQLLWVNKVNRNSILLREFLCLVDGTKNVNKIIKGGPKISVNKPSFDRIRRLVFLDLNDNIFIKYKVLKRLFALRYRFKKVKLCPLLQNRDVINARFSP